MSNKHLQNKRSIPHSYPTLHQVNTSNNSIKHNQSNFTIESTCTDILPASISKILETKIHKEYLTNKDILILSDFNIQHHTNDYLRLCSNLAKYNIKQYIHKYTTIHNTTIDFVFTNMQIKKINILYAHWSDHNIIQLQMYT